MHSTHFTLDRCDRDYKSIVNHLTDDIAEDKIIFLTSYYESHLLDSRNYYLFVQNTIHGLKQLKPRWKIFVLFDSVYEKDYQLIKTFGADDVLFLDYFLYGLVYNIRVHDVSKVSNKWNKFSTKFLCLTGKPFKINRLGLLYKIFQKKLLTHQNCIWSLFENPSITSEIQLVNIVSEMPELSRQKIIEFFKNNENYPDTVRGRLSVDRKKFYVGAYKYDVNLYSQTKFSVCAETHFSCTSAPFITEKTWRAILNHHPFIIAGDTGTCDKLNKMSFVTYEKFLKYPDYDLVDDNIERLNLIVDNIEFWYHHLNDYEDEIKEITDYNHQWLLNRYGKIVDLITNFAKKNNLAADVSEIVLSDPSHEDEREKKSEHFVEFYNAVKDRSWPDVYSHEDFDSLSDKIKSELIQQFGYVHTDD